MAFATIYDNWQTEKRSIRERAAQLINNPLMSDIKFVITDSSSMDKKDKGTIHAHKFLLSLGSPVFRAMFYSSMADTREEIPLDDCDPRSFLDLLRYLYSDELHLTSGNVFELLYLSKKYLVPFLTESCCQFLETELRENNVFRILEHARLFSESHLEQQCWKLLDAKTSACLHTEGLLWISHATLSSLFKRDSLTLVDGECAVFKAAMRWASANCKARGFESTEEKIRRVLNNAIHLIRFPMIPPRLFSEIVVPTGILTEKEISQVYLFHKQGAVANPEMKFSCIPRGPLLQFQNSHIELSRCYRYRENHIFPSSESFTSVSENLKFLTSREVYFAGVRLYAHKDVGKSFLVQLRVYRCRGLKEEVANMRGTFTVGILPRELANRVGFDVLVPKPFLVSRETQFNAKINIVGTNEARASPNRGVPMKFVKCDGIDFKFEGQSRQVLEVLFYSLD
ncbi:BTB/POZ domain-containing protein 6-B-like [Montipora capricornis]|uniref:BTB/POZ domain-containing protein 6-B-like n=1 Tax=Montipora capricornis TaxID=246305 RepID=UPI0035F170FA